MPNKTKMLRFIIDLEYAAYMCTGSLEYRKGVPGDDSHMIVAIRLS